VPKKEQEEMEMQMYIERFGEEGARETRMAKVVRGWMVPEGEYWFVESYCTDEECDCRRVVISVVTKRRGWETWATINYGWESKQYYEEWVGGADKEWDYQGPELDPMNEQSIYAEELLKIFKKEVEGNREYAERLKRHYQKFKERVREEAEQQRERRKRKRKLRLIKR
jgi:hypothetical protein